jgi:hypothetical protein
MVSICLQAFLTSFHEISIHTQKLFFRSVLNFCSNVVSEFINSVRAVSINSMSTNCIIEINKIMYMMLLIKVYENLIHGLGTCRWARTSYIPAAAWHKNVRNALYQSGSSIRNSWLFFRIPKFRVIILCCSTKLKFLHVSRGCRPGVFEITWTRDMYRLGWSRSGFTPW